jgi:hypothetical protein
VADVADHPHDRRGCGCGRAELQPLADRVGPAEQLPRHRLIDHHDARGRRSVRGRERTTSYDRNAHRAEVVVHRPAKFHFRPRADSGGRPVDGHFHRDVRTAEWKPRRAAHRDDTRQRRQPRKQVRVERPELVAGLVPRGQRDLHRQPVILAKAGIDREHGEKAAQQQSSPEREHQRERDFADDQSGLKPAMRAAVRRTASAVGERALQVGTRRDDRGRNSDRESRRQREREREKQHGRVGVHFAQPRECRRSGDDEQPNAPADGRQRDQSARACEHRRFEQRLRDETTARGAERRSNRHLAASRDAAGEEHVREIRARHQQHEPDAAEQQQERGTGRADRLLVQRHDGRADAPVRIRVRDGRLARDARDFVRRLRCRDPGFQPSDDRQEPRAADERDERVVRSRRWGRRREQQRSPRVDRDRPGGAGSEHRPVREDEIGRHHADEGRELPLDVQRAADHVRIAAQARPPECIADQQRARVFLVGEEPPQFGSAAEHLEQTRGDGRDGNPFGWTGSIDERRCRDETDGGVQIAERRGTAEVDEVERGDRISIALRRRICTPDHHEPVGVRIGERLEQDALDHREDGGVRADAQRERGDGGRRKRGAAPQDARRIPQIRQQRFPGHHRCPFAVEPQEKCVQQQIERAARERCGGGEPAARPSGEHAVVQRLPHRCAESLPEGGRVQAHDRAYEAAVARHERRLRSSRRAAVTCDASRSASARAAARPIGVKR